MTSAENWKQRLARLFHRTGKTGDHGVFTCFAVTTGEKTRGLQGPDAASSLNIAKRCRLFTRQNIPRNPIGLVTNPARIWLLPNCLPMSHHRCRTRPGTTRLSTLDDWATSNGFRAMCFTPTYTFAVRTGEGVPILLGHRDRTAMELWVLRHISVCSPHLWQNQNLRLLPSMPRKCDCAEKYRLERRGASTELLSVCKVTFKLRRHRLGESIYMTVSALDVLTDRWENRLAASRLACVRVVLSFLVFELGDDFGCTWPRDTRSSFPETEVPVGAAHVASFSFH